MNPIDLEAARRDGRDEMNLADFPISALQRAQKSDGQGGKLDRLEFSATRYDASSRQRVAQKVTLTSTAGDGLPTPADEHVILALLHVAKHSTNFDDATVHFAPSQLFAIMGWATNGRSYTRLRDVLRRLKALTIRYENAWWDAAGRGYEEEVATGIISGYRIAHQVSGPRTKETALESWVTWTQQFHDSLKNGNLKRLDLETFFKLSTPTAQRMYRFLDKRFYNTDVVSMDLIEFACGHVGLSAVDNVALLKRRLTPGIEELEAIGFIAKAEVSERYEKVKAGQWRVTFLRGQGSGVRGQDTTRRASEADSVTARRASEADSVTARRASEGDSVTARRASEAAQEPEASATDRQSAAHELARGFYHLWDASTPAIPGPRDIEQAALMLAGRDKAEARELVSCLVRVTRQQWPECRSLSGAMQKYLGEALRLRQGEVRRATGQAEARRRVEEARQEDVNRQSLGQRLQDRWNAMSEAEREVVAQRVRQRLGASAPAAFMHRLCLEELGRMEE